MEFRLSGLHFGLEHSLLLIFRLYCKELHRALDHSDEPFHVKEVKHGIDHCCKDSKGLGEGSVLAPVECCPTRVYDEDYKVKLVDDAEDEEADSHGPSVPEVSRSISFLVELE